MDCNGHHDWVLRYDPPEGIQANKERHIECFICGIAFEESE